jgi:benzylsuccinate CoA-transferase BbsF subunit
VTVDQVADRRPRARRGPLAGIRVTDFGWVGVGPMATRLLADFGAEVIKVEDVVELDRVRRLPIYKGGGSRTYGDEDAAPDPNRSGMFNNYSRNKLGVTLNMRLASGRAVAERLIAASDVVAENFAAGVLERWGLTLAHIRELRPDIITCRMTGYGQVGPEAGYRSYGPVVQAVSGLSHISGLPGREPSGIGLSYMDNLAAYYNSAAILMALYRRNITGVGADIDTSAIEVGINLLGPVLLDVQAGQGPTRRPGFPSGNMHEFARVAPHGVYPALGEDRWIAISIYTDREWHSLVEVMGDVSLFMNPAFGTMEARFRNHDELDEIVGRWTRQFDAAELMTRLQARGVRAGAVQTAQDVFDHDPQTLAREVMFSLDHPVIGAARFESAPIHGGAVDPDHWRSAPLLGEDNDYVFRGILGMSDEEYGSLVDEGAIIDTSTAASGAL